MCDVCRAHLDKLLDYCQNGVDEGATLVYGGKRVDKIGVWVYVCMCVCV